MKIKRAWRNCLIPPFITGFIKRFTLRAEIKDGKLKVEKGLISKDISMVEIAHITDVQVNKSLFQRLVGVGNIGIATSGTAGHEVVLDGIGSPMKIHNKIRESSKNDG